MSRARPVPFRRAAAGFTLIELIGVLAIIAILAGVLAPNALRSLDRAAVKAETETVRRLGEQVELYVRTTGTVPTATNWTTTIGTYADLGTANIATNARQIARVFILDPAATPAPRALLLSGMRTGLALPTAANINTALRFQDIWGTADGSVPSTTSWAGWSAWSAVANSGDFLVIRRINLSAIYSTDLQNLTITLKNSGGTTASYVLVSPAGAAGAAQNVAAGATVILTAQKPKTRIDLYRTSGGGTLNYSYVLNTLGRTFEYDGTNWKPQ